MKQVLVELFLFTVAYLALRLILDAPGWGAVIGGWVVMSWPDQKD